MRRVLSPLGLAAGTPPRPPPTTPRRHRRPLSQSRDLTTHKRVQKRLLQPSWSQANGTERPVARVRALVHREFARLLEGLAAAVNPSWSQVYGCLWQHTGQSRRLETPPHAHPPLPLVFRRTSLSTYVRPYALPLVIHLYRSPLERSYGAALGLVHRSGGGGDVCCAFALLLGLLRLGGLRRRRSRLASIGACSTFSARSRS